jgi:hypothetical protein
LGEKELSENVERIVYVKGRIYKPSEIEKLKVTQG